MASRPNYEISFEKPDLKTCCNLRFLLMPTKVLLVGAFPVSRDKPVYGGIETACKALKESSFTSCNNCFFLDSTQAENPPPSLLFRIVPVILRFAKLLFSIKRFRPHVAIIFCSSGLSLIEKSLMAAVLEACGVRVALFPRSGRIIDHTLSSRFLRIKNKFIFSIPSMLLCQTPRWESLFLDTLSFPRSKTKLVYNWSASPSLLNIGASRNYRTSYDHFSMLFVGWLEFSKGIVDLLDAFQYVNSLRSSSLTVVGSGKAQSFLDNRIKSLGLEKCVNSLGWLEPEQLPFVMEKHDVLIHPSHYEGFPNSVIEAMSAGMAVVATSLPSVASILTHDEECLFAKPRDAKSLARQLLRLYSEQGLFRKISRTGYLFASENFSLPSAVSSLNDVVKQLATNES